MGCGVFHLTVHLDNNSGFRKRFFCFAALLIDHAEAYQFEEPGQLAQGPFHQEFKTGLGALVLKPLVLKGLDLFQDLQYRRILAVEIYA